MPERVQVVWAHPRSDSLTAQVVQDVVQELRAGGREVDELDLYRMQFDPVLYEADEPDWENSEKVYSDEAMRFIDLTRGAAAVVFVFPVWWYSVPAIMKGFIDRVWNYGQLYGAGQSVDLRQVVWIGLTGYSREQFAKRDYTRMMEQYLNVGIAGYCGAERSRLVLLYNTLADGVQDLPAHFAGLREEARVAARQLVQETADSMVS